MMPLDAVHAPLAVVHMGIELIVLVGLLKNGNTRIGLVAYHSDDDRTLPFSATRRRYSFFLQHRGNLGAGFAFQNRCEYASYGFCLFLVDDHSAVNVFIAVSRSTYHIGAVLEALLNAPFVVVRKGAGFILRKARHNGEHQFALHLARVDVFLLEENVNTHRTEPADGLHALHGVAGKSADGLYENIVYESPFTVGKHAEQTVALGHLRAGDPFIVIQTRVLPVRIVQYDLFVVFFLRVQADKLIGGIGGYPGIGRHTQLFRLFRRCVDLRYPFHCLASCP